GIARRDPVTFCDRPRSSARGRHRPAVPCNPSGGSQLPGAGDSERRGLGSFERCRISRFSGRLPGELPPGFRYSKRRGEHPGERGRVGGGAGKHGGALRRREMNFVFVPLWFWGGGGAAVGRSRGASPPPPVTVQS